jgi:hypothetical protein
MPSLPLIALTLLASALPPPDDTDAKNVALRFMSLTEAKDWAAAAAMLTSDAQILIGHVGGPLNAETLPVTGTMNSPKTSCALADTQQTPSRLPDHPELRFVEAHYTCLKEGGPKTHEMTVTYLVQGAKIAGYMLN